MDLHIHGMDVKKNKSIMDFFMLREKQVVSEGKTARIHHGFAWIRFLREKQAVSEGKQAHTPDWGTQHTRSQPATATTLKLPMKRAS